VLHRWAPPIRTFLALALVAASACRQPELRAHAKPGPTSIVLPLPTSLDEARAMLQGACGCAARPLMGIEEVHIGRRVRREGHAFDIPWHEADAIVNANHAAWRAAGFYLFVHERRFGFEGEPDEVAVMPTADKYEVLRLMGTSAGNYGKGPAEITAWLRQLEPEQPFELTAIRDDALEGRFLTPVRDPDALAARMVAFCPEILTHGSRDIPALTAILREHGAIYFWWD